ncbi:MAG: phosphotyrosine protein phosphatase [Candidatus Binataceae bacterium]
MKKVLMVCTGNLDRSPTAAMLLAEMCAPMWVTSAGTEPWAKNQVTVELIEEADVVCVMEEAHRRFIIERFGNSHTEKVVVLDIPDNYVCWEPKLVQLLKPKLRAALRLATEQDEP